MSRTLINSNVNWLGKIPDNWTVAKVKNKFFYHKNIAKEESIKFDRVSLTLNGVILRDKEDANGLQPEDFYGYQIVNKNDIIFKLIDLENVNTSRVGRSSYEGITSPAYILLHEKDEANRYYDYYFKNLYYQEVFNNLGGNGVRSAINKDDLLNIPLLILPTNEAKRIVDYLDDKCSIINKTIDDNKKAIELLEEYKKSIVDTYLFSDQEVKYVKLSRIFKFSQGTQIDLEYQSDIRTEEYPYRFLRIIDYTQGNSEPRYVSSSYKNYLINTDDIALVRYGASAGFVCRGLAGVLANNMFKLNKLSNVENDFIYYFFNSNRIVDEMLPKSTAMPALDFSTMYNIKMPLYDELTQKSICLKLNNSFNKLNRIIEYRKQIIEKLEEYKKSLIYEVVTGKKEV